MCFIFLLLLCFFTFFDNELWLSLLAVLLFSFSSISIIMWLCGELMFELILVVSTMSENNCLSLYSVYSWSVSLTSFFCLQLYYVIDHHAYLNDTSVNLELDLSILAITAGGSGSHHSSICSFVKRLNSLGLFDGLAKSIGFDWYSGVMIRCDTLFLCQSKHTLVTRHVVYFLHMLDLSYRYSYKL